MYKTKTIIYELRVLILFYFTVILHFKYLNAITNFVLI